MRSDLRPLGDYVSLASGNTPPKSDPAYWNGTTPWVSAKDMQEFWIEDSQDHLTDAGVSAASRVVPAGTVLMLTRGMTLHNRVPICRVGKESAFNQDVKAVLPKTTVIPRFIPYLLTGNHDRLHERVDAAGHGTGRLNTEAILSLPVRVPSEEQQLAIAELGEAIDERILLLRHKNSTLEAIAQAMFKSWFVDFDPVRAKAEGREPEGMDAATAALFPDTFKASGPGLIPEGWEVSNLGDQLEILSGGTPKTKVPEYWDGDMPWFSVVDAPKEGQVFVFDTERRITQSGLENSPTRLLPANTTIISARGTVGKLAVTGQPMAMNQSCYGLRPADGVGEFFTYLSVQRFVDHLQRIAHGAVFDTITRSSFSQAQAVKAPKEVISAFEALVTPFMERLHANGRQAITLAKLRDTLLPRLISGKLRLPEAGREVEAATA